MKQNVHHSLATNNPKGIIYQLKNATFDLDPKSAPEFYRQMIGCLTSTEINISTEILKTFYLLIQKPQLRQIFIEEGIHCNLPVQQQEYQSIVLDILNTLSKTDCECFNSKIAQMIKSLIPNNSHKCLILLAHLLQNFKLLTDSWSFSDLLFTEWSYFQGEEDGELLCSLIIFMFKKYPTFRKCRITNCWNTFVKLSNVSSEKTVLSAFNSMPYIIKRADAVFDRYPTKQIIHHFSNKNLINSIINLLIETPPAFFGDDAEIMIKQLIDYSSVTNVGALILMQYCDIDPTASMIVCEQSEWMGTKRTTPRHTLRLIAVNMRHEKSRGLIASAPELPALAQMVVGEGDPDLARDLSVILRKLPIDSEGWRSIARANVLRPLFRMVGTEEELRLVNAIAKKRFTRDFDVALDDILTIIEDDGELALKAAAAATAMARFRQCAVNFEKFGLQALIAASRQPGMKEMAERFGEQLRITRDAVENLNKDV